MRAVLSLVLLLGPGCKLESKAIPLQDGAPGIDARVTTDAAIDAPIDAVSDVGCSGLDGDVVMYLTMNTPNVTIWPDLTGDHDGRTEPGTTGVIEAPAEECGRAFNATTGMRLVIADSPDFDLEVGSLDVYALVPAAGNERGIVSRDAAGEAMPGHFELGFTATNQVIVRIQDGAGGEAYRCSAAQTAGAWIHIGVNFGLPDLELFVDGVAAAETAATYVGAERVCGAELTAGIDGNDNPWLVGFSSLESDEGSHTPVSRPLLTGVDELRLSRVRRSY